MPLLRHVSGLNALAARELVEYRKNNGPFRNREQLKGVPQIGEARLTRATREVAFAEARLHAGGRDVVRATGVFKLMNQRPDPARK